jgi:hypothetical protein
MPLKFLICENIFYSFFVKIIIGALLQLHSYFLRAPHSSVKRMEAPL